MVLDDSGGPLNIDGTTRYSPSVHADHVRSIGNDLCSYSSGECFQLGDASTVPDTITEHMLIEGNFIHVCGGKRDGHGHAIYAAQPKHLQIIGNRTVEADSRGARLHAEVDHTLVVNNIIDSFGLIA